MESYLYASFSDRVWMQGGEEMKASIALQILPLSTDKGRLAVIEDVIEYLQKQPVRQLVTPFETVLEGEWEDLFPILCRSESVV